MTYDSKGRRPRAVVLVMCAIAAIGLGLHSWVAQRKQALELSSCVNHMSQWKSLFAVYLIDEQPLPQDLDTPAGLTRALARLGHDAYGASLHDGLRCPGARMGSGVDYVFVGGGLPVSALRQDPLLLFCPAGSHTGSCRHVMFGTWSPRRVCDEGEFLRILEDALQQARDGSIPYSVEAQDRMAREIEKLRR